MSKFGFQKIVMSSANFRFGPLIVLSLVQIIVEALAGYRFYYLALYYEPWIIYSIIVSTGLLPAATLYLAN